MNQTEIQQALRDGIQAIRAGDRARGRELLLQVVAADERVEPAWLWLSTALDDPADQIMALENALVLNPGNAQARQRLGELRAQLGLAPASVPVPPAPPPPPPPPPESQPASTFLAPADSAVDEADDPLQCPYCGQLTAEDEMRCPHCRRSLLAPGRWGGGIYLYSLLVLFGLDVQVAVLQAALPLAVKALAGERFVAQALAYARLGDGLVSVPFWILVVRAILLGGTLTLFLNDVALAYPLAALVLAVDVLANLAAWRAGWAPDSLATINLALSSVILLIVLAAMVSQQLARRRMFTTLDRGLFSGLDYYRRGREHLRKGRRALAVLHLQKAVVLQPRTIQFYKELAIVQAQLGRRARARQTLEAGAQRAPDDREFAQLIVEIERGPAQTAGRG